jgi:hypothetical protein
MKSSVIAGRRQPANKGRCYPADRLASKRSSRSCAVPVRGHTAFAFAG